MKTIRETFASYIAKAYPGETFANRQDQLREIRRAFYAGVQGFRGQLELMPDDPALHEKELVKIITELRQFLQDVQQGIM